MFPFSFFIANKNPGGYTHSRAANITAEVVFHKFCDTFHVKVGFESCELNAENDVERFFPKEDDDDSNEFKVGMKMFPQKTLTSAL